jgi:hypothetical protein
MQTPILSLPLPERAWHPVFHSSGRPDAMPAPAGVKEKKIWKKHKKKLLESHCRQNQIKLAPRYRKKDEKVGTAVYSFSMKYHKWRGPQGTFLWVPTLCTSPEL